MVLKFTYSCIFSLLILIGNAQSKLFFSDSYHTNLYKSNKNLISFNNNLFALMDENTTNKVDDLFQDFFTANNINVEGKFQHLNHQITYTFTDNNTDYLIWSKNWFQEYESLLLEILNNNIAQQLPLYETTFTDIHEAVLYKIVNTAFIHFQDRINNTTKTAINISSKNIDVKDFLKNNILPNNSLKRTITSAKSNYFNEGFYIENKKYTHFIIAPNSKARLVDCFSAHLLCNILQIDAPVYLNNISYIAFNNIDSAYLTEAAMTANLAQSEMEFYQTINDASNSFYNLYDLNDVNYIIENYKWSDLQTFLQLYFVENSVNEALTPSDSTLAYTSNMLNDSIQFKENSYHFKSSKDSVQLAKISKFLEKNPLTEIQILGLANQAEYLKVDRKRYYELIEIYKEYTPIKVSKKIDLPLYRALMVFEYLFKNGIAPESMICISKTTKNNSKKMAYVHFNYKM